MSMSNVDTSIELFLASASPRRREVLGLLGLPYVNGVSPVDEEAAQERYGGHIENLAVWLAKHKATGALKLPEAQGRLVVTADTTVILENDALGKPRNQAHARELLRTLRGRRHYVITGMVVSTLQQGKTIMRSASCITPVLMRNYSDEEIDMYVASGDAMDKAGAYGIQNPIFQPTERIDGCYFNVVGLPLCTLAELLSEFGVYPARQHIRREVGCPWSEKCLI